MLKTEYPKELEMQSEMYMMLILMILCIELKMNLDIK